MIKIQAWKIAYAVFFLSCLLNGTIAEVIMLISLVLVFYFKKHDDKQAKFKKKVALFVFVYLSLFLIQVLYRGSSIQIIRLYGLTKCICAPAIVYLFMGEISKTDFVINFNIITLSLFNIFYIVDCLLTGDSVHSLGSVNGCSGIGIIMLPVIIHHLKANKDGIMLCVDSAAIVLIVAMVILSDSTTTLAILLMQAGIISGDAFIKLFKKKSKYVFIIGFSGVISIMLTTVLVVRRILHLRPTDLKTRVGIWQRAYDQHFSSDWFTIIFGSGDNHVQMMSKSLEAHNMYMETLLIYGLTGTVFLATMVIVTSYSILSKKRIHIGLMISLLSYLLVCFFHPFYTGIFLFQFYAVSSILFLTKELTPSSTIERLLLKIECIE